MRTALIGGNCWVAKLAVELSGAMMVIAIYSNHPGEQEKHSRYSSIDGMRPRHYTTDIEISRVDLASVCQPAADSALAISRWC